ncbi:odorant receptor 13a-like [Osmia lignaria lignaria]|uniref:odorant receptor 13a-like n=1 Tax=Osmia lignaria lignaria TaxID=1437193 RepID=UPI00402BDAC4
MSIIGLWPEPYTKKSHWETCKAIIVLLLLILFGTGPQTANLFFIWGDVELMTENLCSANIPGINVLLKMLFSWYHRDTFESIIKSSYDDWNAPKTEEERETMINNAKVGRFISILGSILTGTMMTMNIILRSFIIITCDKNETRADHLAIYPGYFPYDIRKTSLCIFTNVGQAIAAYITTIAYTSIDTFIGILVIHICGQFEILKTKLERLMGDEDCGRDAEQIQKELVWIVKRHEDLNQSAAKIEECFNILLLMQMLLGTTQLCFQGFIFFSIVLKNDIGLLSGQILYFILFVLFILVHIYIYCYIGEKLLVQNREMSVSAYESNWFNVSPSESKCLLFIMQRSHRPLRLTAGKFSTFSIELFSTVNNTSIYLTFLANWRAAIEPLR